VAVKGFKSVMVGDELRNVEIDLDEASPLYWMDVEAGPAESSLVINAFCPTGPGGGVDPTCSPGGGDGEGHKAGIPFEDFPTFGVLKKIANLPGSTGPVLYKDVNTGTQWVVKSGADKEKQLFNEIEADNAYRVLGVKVPPSKVMKTGPAELGKISQFIEGGQTLADWKIGKTPAQINEMHKEIGKGFVADALLANWDVAGLSNDNILIKDGTPYRIDNGGALKYRAQGQPKGAAFGPTIPEFFTLRDSIKNPNTAQIFAHLTNEDIAGQIKQIIGKKDELLNSVGSLDTRQTLEHRLQYLQAVGKAVSPPVAPPVLKTSPSIVPPTSPPPTAPKPSGTTATIHEATHLHTPAGIEEHINANKGTTPFVQLYLDKLKFMNPNGIKDGVFHIPTFPKGEKSSLDKVAALEKMFPPGVIIKQKSVTAKKLAEAVKTGKAEHASIKSQKVLSLLDKAVQDAFGGATEHETKLGTAKVGGLLEKAHGLKLTAVEKHIAEAADKVNTDPSKAAGPMHVSTIASKMKEMTGTHMEHEEIAQVLKNLGVSLKPTVVLPNPDYKHIQGAASDVNDKKAIAQKAHAQYLKELSPKQVGAIKDYTGSSYRQLNKMMRSCPPNFECVEGQYKPMMEHILSAVHGAPKLASPVIVKRGITVDSKTGENLLAAAAQAQKTGDGFHMPSITSTSILNGFGGNVKFEMKIRSGLYVRPISSVPSEEEVIVSPKTKFKVLGVTAKGGTHIIQLEEDHL
jgi:hypothetical protein